MSDALEFEPSVISGRNEHIRNLNTTILVVVGLMSPHDLILFNVPQSGQFIAVTWLQQRAGYGQEGK